MGFFFFLEDLFESELSDEEESGDGLLDRGALPARFGTADNIVVFVVVDVAVVVVVLLVVDWDDDA